MAHLARAVTFDELIGCLADEVAAGNVNMAHDGPLTLYRYTEQCGFDRRWSPWSLIARGLIVDHQAKRIVATPFPKFFNYGEGMAPQCGMEPLPDEPFIVTEKMDGSLGIVFWHGDRWRVSTRGSFISTQAKWAEERIASVAGLMQGVTYLVEIIYTDNRIVIPYDYEGLVLLSAYHENGVEFTRDELEAASDQTGMRLVKAVHYGGIDDLLTLAKSLPANQEGFVVRFESGRRIKIKGDEYVRIHKLISRVTPLAVFDMLVAGDDIDKAIRELPEEFRTDLEAIRRILTDRFDSFMASVSAAYLATRDMDDKSLGLWLQGQSEYPSEIARWIFPCRKKNFLTEALTPCDMRRRAFDSLRPTANRLEGYTPSTAVNRFAAEVG